MAMKAIMAALSAQKRREEGTRRDKLKGLRVARRVWRRVLLAAQPPPKKTMEGKSLGVVVLRWVRRRVSL